MFSFFVPLQALLKYSTFLIGQHLMYKRHPYWFACTAPHQFPVQGRAGCCPAITFMGHIYIASMLCLDLPLCSTSLLLTPVLWVSTPVHKAYVLAISYSKGLTYIGHANSKGSPCIWHTADGRGSREQSGRSGREQRGTQGESRASLGSHLPKHLATIGSLLYRHPVLT